METRKIDYKFIKKCVREVRDDSEWVKGARQEHRQSSSSDQCKPIEKKRKGHLLEVTVECENRTRMSDIVESSCDIMP